jgi:hypothetical protein
MLAPFLVRYTVKLTLESNRFPRQSPEYGRENQHDGGECPAEFVNRIRNLGAAHAGCRGEELNRNQAMTTLMPSMSAAKQVTPNQEGAVLL